MAGAFFRRIDSFIAGKVFIYSWIYSTSKCWFVERPVLGRIPLAGRAFGLFTSTLVVAVVLAACILSPIFSSISAVFSRAFAFEKRRFITPHGFSIGLSLIVLIAFVLSVVFAMK
ncbi:Uncharacterised protein [uncultured archaeon]|nr:Uncharacterised protein [uncultured archaeon]